ncbi:serine peptidase [Streptomyces sp. NPDC004311]|uniref:serine peptidase n=1 Tax=Streptomyces sp. NPDC004311 TaxID=3364698 RepID=UPI0036AC7E5E
MKILGIHGIGNLRVDEDPETVAGHMSALWEKHLAAGGTPDADVHVAYYADLLQEHGHQGEDGRLEELSDSEETILMDMFSLLKTPTAAPGIAQGWLTYLLRDQLQDIVASKACAPGLMEWFLVRFAKEVHRYLEPGPARLAVRNRVREALTAHRPDVVIAHSLGSVIAYEALHEYEDLEVPLLITLGSPLALPKAVFHRLTPGPELGRGRRPDAVRRWANLADPGDLVALPIRGISARFDGVESDRHCSAHQTYRFHHVEEYLKTPEVAALMAAPQPTGAQQA